MSSDAQSYYDTYRDSGFHFPNSILTTYALSLRTKPFVILSGISGTGKTKIAQLFDVPVKSHEETSSNLPMLTIKIPKVFDRFNFPQALLPEILTDEELTEFNKKAAEFRERNDGGNFSDTYILSVEDEFGVFQVGIYGQRASSPLIRGRFFKSSRDTKSIDYNATEHLTKHYKPTDILKLEKIGDKLFRVASVNNEEIVKQVRKDELNTINRRCFIPVRSDWTDNSELFGFYNLIEQKYHVPYFLEFVLTAINNPEYPFFAILDEMNLSKVEHYFSDILSCLESRFFKDGNIYQEEVVLYNGLKQLITDSESFEYIPSAIELPLNLYISGTVNIDESTYMFSPKVLDRANVIEFNDVDLDTYGTDLHADDEEYKLTTFPDFTEFTLATKEEYEQLPELSKQNLVNINKILGRYNLHFGYRTVNEVALYIHNAMSCIDGSEGTQLRALDHQLMQKVFPKLNGGYASLEAPIHEVLLYLSKQQNLSEIKAQDTSFPKTVSKLQRMYKNLSANGYTSFID